MSDTVVVDASLALKWVLRELDSNIAIILLNKWNSEGTEVIAPALFAYEVTNILHREAVKGKLTYDEAKKLLTKLFSIGTSLEFSEYQYKDISTRAMEFAHIYRLPAAYDAHYLALAERKNCEYWTADLRLWNAIGGKLSWVRRLSDYQNVQH